MAGYFLPIPITRYCRPWGVITIITRTPHLSLCHNCWSSSVLSPHTWTSWDQNLRKYVCSFSSLSRHYWLLSQIIWDCSSKFFENPFHFSQFVRFATIVFFLVYLSSCGVWILSELRWNSQILSSLQLGERKIAKLDFTRTCRWLAPMAIFRVQ